MWHYSCYIGFPINVQKSQTVCLLIEGGQRELQLMGAQSSLMHLRSVAVVDVALVSLFISSWCGLTWNPRWGFPSSIFNEICPWPKISLASPAARPKMNPNCFALATHATFAFQKERTSKRKVWLTIFLKPVFNESRWVPLFRFERENSDIFLLNSYIWHRLCFQRMQSLIKRYTETYTVELTRNSVQTNMRFCCSAEQNSSAIFIDVRPNCSSELLT